MSSTIRHYTLDVRLNEKCSVDDLLHVLHRHWPDIRPGDSLDGGSRNIVIGGTLRGQRVVARRSRRDAAALEWELGLLQRLHGAGIIVPAPIPSCGGQLGLDGVSVVRWIDGDPPQHTDDWLAVAAALGRIHAATTALPQRPGFVATRELLSIDRGGDVDLMLMEPDVVARCRAAWRSIAGEARSVIHGDPGSQNLRLSRNGVGFIDWDEARVDASILDFAAPPLVDMVGMLPKRRRAVFRAGLAWEVANGWTIEPDYAQRTLQRLIACE